MLDAVICASLPVWEQGMRRFVITTFTILYAMLMFSVSADRTFQEVDGLAHLAFAHHFHGFGKTEKSEPHLPQTRLVETQYVVEVPREAPADADSSERFTPPLSFEYRTAPDGQPFSSRPPPFVG
jgi:hypothetical protein